MGLAFAEYQKGQGDTVTACSLTADLLMVQAILFPKRCKTCSAFNALCAMQGMVRYIAGAVASYHVGV